MTKTNRTQNEYLLNLDSSKVYKSSSALKN